MKKYSDSTLMRLTKAELIEQLRCAEYNQEVAEEQLAQQAENVKDWVPVVRCKDCIWYTHKAGCPFACSKLHDSKGNLPYEDDFCSRGERRE